MADTTAHRLNRFGLLALTASAALVLSACGGGDEGGSASNGTGDGGGDAAGGGTIRVGYLATGSSLPLFATAEKYADEVGIDIEMVQVNSGNESLTGVATAQYDVGFAGIGSGAYNAFDEGLPVTYVAPMHSGYLEDYFIISAEHAGSAEEAATLAEDMSALSGESFAANAPGVVTEALLGFALEEVGLSMSEVDLQHIPFPDQIPALANGGIAGGILSEPFPTQAEESDSGYRPWETPDTEPLPFTGIIYNTDWAAEHPDLAEGFMEAYSLAAADLAENGWDTEEMLTMVEEYTGADPEIVAASRQHHIKADLSVDLEQVVRYQEFFMEQGSLNYEEIIPEEEIWDFQWRDAVLGG